MISEIAETYAQIIKFPNQQEMLQVDPKAADQTGQRGRADGAAQAGAAADGRVFCRGMVGNYCNTTASTKKGFGNISQPLKIIGSPSRTRTYNLVVNFILVNPRLCRGTISV